MIADWNSGLIASLNKCGSIKELNNRLSSAFQLFGVKHWLVSVQLADSIVSPSTIILNNYPDDWWLEYLQSNWIDHDPITHYATHKDRPRFWSLKGWEDLPGHRWDKDDLYYGPETSQFMMFVKSVAVRSGLVLPFHTSDGSHCCLNLSHPAIFKKAQEDLKLARSLTPGIMPELYVTILRLLEQAPPQLTTQERAALSHFSILERYEDIAKAMSLSPRTVRAYIKSAQLKLNVSSRQHAVAKATKLGLIKPRRSFDNLIFTCSENLDIEGQNRNRQIRAAKGLGSNILLSPR